MIQVEVKRLTDTAKLPIRGSAGAAGWDLFADLDKEIWIDPHWHSVMIPTGLSMAIPPEWEGEIRPRSGMACKRGLRPANTPGTIDSDYRGEIKICLYNDSNEPQAIFPGDRIAQILFKPAPTVELLEVNELDETERSDGGFGSTGEK